MSADLSGWLSEHRVQLMPRWLASLSEARGGGRNGYDGPDSGDVAVATTVDLLDQIYEGMVLAARGAPALLQEHLCAASHGDGHQFLLHELLGFTFALRRVAFELLRCDTSDPVHTFRLMDDLETLIEQAASALADSWVHHTDGLIQEREFIAASLDQASAAADQRALQLKALNEISQRLSASLESDQLLNLVGSSLSGLLEVAHISIWLAPLAASEDDATLRVVQSWGAELHSVAEMTVAGENKADLVWKAYRDGVVLFDQAPDPASQGPWYQPGCGVLSIPLMVNERSIGVVVLQDARPIEQLRLQQDLAVGVVNQAAIALQNARLYAQVTALNAELEQRVNERTHELQEERDRLATVHEVSIEVSSTLDLDHLLKTTLAMLIRITAAEHGSIMMLEPDTGHLVSRATLGVSNPTNFTRFPIGTGIAGWVAQYKKPAMVDDVSQDDRWVSLPEGSLRKREGAMISVPLTIQNEILGVLTLSHRRTGYFDEGHLRLLMASASAIAIGINNANLYTMISTEAERRYELLDRQQKEASQIAAILQSLSDGVIVCDLYGSVLSANPAAGRILQRDWEELILWNLNDLLVRYLGPRVEEMPLAVLLSRPLDSDLRPRTFTTDAKIGMQVARMTLGPVLKDNGELLGALLVIRDISLEIESDRLKTEFIGTMSHELRTPMTAIKGFTQLLAMGSLGPLNDTQREFVNTIYQNTERMITLINDVLDITKIESGSVDLEVRSLHLAEVLSGVVAELRGLVEGRQHSLTISMPPGLPLVRADAQRLRQILFNLLSNAAKYTPRGGEVSVEAREAVMEELPVDVRYHLVPGRRYLRVDIRDTGVGIAPQDLDKVFQRFYRTENPLKVEAGGTGLGLSVVKPLLDLLGGKIWVRSEVGEGSTFSFVLPVA